MKTIKRYIQKELVEAKKEFKRVEKEYKDFKSIPFDVDSTSDLFEYGFVRWLEVALAHIKSAPTKETLLRSQDD